MGFDNEHPKLRERVSAGRQSDSYRLENDDRLLKIYRTPHSQARMERIGRLISSGSSRLRARCAWPMETFTFQEKDALAVAFIAHQSTLAQRIPPAKRQASFPDLDWRGVVRFAGQLAQCVATVHAENMLVGDLDLHNVLIDSHNELILTRCDSFLLEGEAIDPSDSAAELQCPPPELQIGRGESTVRTNDHDNFTLARLIFKLVFLDDGQTQNSVGDWAALFNGEHARNAPAGGAHRVTPSMLSPGLVACFRRAADPSSTRSTPRPDAERWSRELAAMASSMRTCEVDNTHTYRADMEGGCPWCASAREAPASDKVGQTPVPPGPSSPSRPTPAQARRSRAFIAFGIAAAGALAFIVFKSSQHASAGNDGNAPEQRANAVISQWFDAINAPQGNPDALLTRRAIGAPMLPMPMNATVLIAMISFPRSCERCFVSTETPVSLIDLPDAGA